VSDLPEARAVGRRRSPEAATSEGGLLTHLRRGPGRPRKADPGHVPGTSQLDTRMNSRSERGALAPGTSAPRLLDLRQTADYMGMSTWTVRDLEAAGVLARVRVPLPGGGELRKLLFDRTDLDRLIASWKDAAAN
jgi:hypothetical protein